MTGVTRGADSIQLANHSDNFTIEFVVRRATSQEIMRIPFADNTTNSVKSFLALSPFQISVQWSTKQPKTH